MDLKRQMSVLHGCSVRVQVVHLYVVRHHSSLIDEVLSPLKGT